MSSLQKSLIAETIHGARASLNDPSRPFTPGDLPRHLFSGDDYTNRPGSSYKMNNVVGKAVDEFQSQVKSSYHGNSQATMHSTNNELSSAQTNSSANVLNILHSDMASLSKMRGGLLPSIDPNSLQGK